VKIGVISDTHGYLDPHVEKIFAGMDHILHAGDIGYASIIIELQLLAPVTAILGNTDGDIGYRTTETAKLAEKKFLIHHIVNPRAPSEFVKERIAKVKPDSVVFGHTHKKFAEIVNGVFFFNPGYAGKPRFGAERSVAILHLEAGKFRPEFVPL
jgi:putative phosphoesterase